MKRFLAFISLVIGALTFVGCESYRDTVRGLGHTFGAITTKDAYDADSYRKVLPGHLGLPPQQVRVEAGAGVTHVTILGVKSESERQRIASELSTLNAKNPKMNPLKWTFE